MASTHTCSNCAYMGEVLNADGEIVKHECRLNPPATHTIHFPTQSISGVSLQVQVLSVFPEVFPNLTWCSKFSSLS